METFNLKQLNEIKSIIMLKSNRFQALESLGAEVD
jgi:hypothetical protein